MIFFYILFKLVITLISQNINLFRLTINSCILYPTLLNVNERFVIVDVVYDYNCM